jgi:DNA-directed RNA polymerase subunit RPC12/RpoP
MLYTVKMFDTILVKCNKCGKFFDITNLANGKCYDCNLG